MTTTLYPFGINGELPSSIEIIDDLMTGGSDKALSAEMGKLLGLLVLGTDAISIDISSATSCGGRILDTGKWSAYEPNYSGALIDIRAYRGRLLREVSGNGGSCAFVKEGFVADGDVAFAQGWTSYELTPGGGTYDFIIPNDASYFYFYLMSKSASYRPQSVTIYYSNS